MENNVMMQRHCMPKTLR